MTAKFKRVYTSCHIATKGIPSWELDYEDENIDVLTSFGYCTIHIHSLFGKVRQVLVENEVGLLYDVPLDEMRQVLALPTVMDMEVYLQDRIINGARIRGFNE